MEKITAFDLGIKEYEIGMGVLRFNPGDPNVYHRFMEADEKLRAVEERLVKKATDVGDDPAAGLKLIAEADREAKTVLSWVFGEQNDFDQILGGANLLGVGTNGERILTNLIHALTPIIQQGATECAKNIARTNAPVGRQK